MSSSPATSADAAEVHDGLPAPRRYWSAATIWLALVMAVLDSTIANIALPTIGRDLHISAAGSIWIVNSYQLAITVLVLPIAALGDKLGYKRVYIVGLAVFTVGSGLCALSHTLAQLTAARVLQGAGAAGIMAINAALLRFTYPKALLGRGVGLNALVVSIASVVGPSLAAAIMAIGAWQWLFAVNVPIGVLTLFVAARALPASVGTGKRFDWLSAVLNAATFGGLITGIESVSREGVHGNFVALGVGLAAAVLLTLRELGQPAPMVPFDLMRIPMFSLSVATSIMSFAAQTVAQVAFPFHLQDGLGRTAIATGLLMTPWPVGVGITAPLAGRLADRYPAGLLAGAGLGLLTTGLVALALMPAGASDLLICAGMGMCGAGFGFFQAPNNRAMISSAPVHRSGATGGMQATARTLGQTAGAVITAVLLHQVGAKVGGPAFGVAAGLAAAGAVISLSRLKLARAPAPPPPPEVEAELAAEG